MTDKKIDDRGQAYPIPSYVNVHGNEVDGCPGMSRRDWFAGQVMDKMFADTLEDVENRAIHPSKVGTIQRIYGIAADRSYMYADAMIERSKR